MALALKQASDEVFSNKDLSMLLQLGDAKATDEQELALLSENLQAQKPCKGDACPLPPRVKESQQMKSGGANIKSIVTQLLTQYDGDLIAVKKALQGDVDEYGRTMSDLTKN